MSTCVAPAHLSKALPVHDEWSDGHATLPLKESVHALGSPPMDHVNLCGMTGRGKMPIVLHSQCQEELSRLGGFDERVVLYEKRTEMLFPECNGFAHFVQI